MKEIALQRIFYAALALLSLVGLGAAMAAGGGAGLAFGLFAVLTLGGGIVCIWERSVVRSAFALMGTFTGIAGLFVLLEADFLAMAQILIYVGGILALILFAVMLTPPDLGERKLVRIASGTVLVGGAGLVLAAKVAGSAHWFVLGAPLDGRAPSQYGSAREIGIGFLGVDQYVVAFELAAVVLTVALVAAVYIARRKRSDLEPPGESGEVR